MAELLQKAKWPRDLYPKDGLIEIPSHPTSMDYVQPKLETSEATSLHQMLSPSFGRSKPDPRK
ncbi:unnamed protein product [Prunus armeniaca]